MDKLHIMALRHSAFYTPLLMTMAGGFLRDEGLEHSYAPATPQCTVPDSIRDGSCQVAQSAVATSFADLEAGRPIDIVHFAKINERDGFYIAGRRPEAEFSWSNLRGKAVLVDHFFQPLAMLKYGLHRQGVAYDELQAIDAGDVAAIERAFRDGQGDYVHMQGPAPQQMERDGVGHVVAAVGDAVGPVAFSSLCASREWLATEAARAFMSAYRRSLAYVIEAPAAELAAREHEAGFFPEIDRAVLTDTIAAYQQLGTWTADPVISEASYENLLEVFLFSGLITMRHAYDKAVVQPPASPQDV
jgi:NitT/TauT family transport system substrate-binding protein